MRLGLNLGYWGAGNDEANLAMAEEADRLGYSVVWAAEAWGSDVVSVLGFLAAKTTRIDIGSAIMQIPARTPAMTAMTAATLDTLSGGRFRLGLGVSGPQVSEGWHGVRFDKPLGRTREYVEIVRKALRREKLTYDGEHYTLPLPDGPGKALRMIIHPVRAEVPVYLAAVGPKNLELAGEIGDGVLLNYLVSPAYNATALEHLAVGAKKAGRTVDDLDRPQLVVCSMDEDRAAALDAARLLVTQYLGQQPHIMKASGVPASLLDRITDVLTWPATNEQVHEAAQLVPDDIVQLITASGTPDECRAKVAEYMAAGCTCPVLYPLGHDVGAMIDAFAGWTP